MSAGQCAQFKRALRGMADEGSRTALVAIKSMPCSKKRQAAPSAMARRAAPER